MRHEQVAATLQRIDRTAGLIRIADGIVISFCQQTTGTRPLNMRLVEEIGEGCNWVEAMPDSYTPNGTTKKLDRIYLVPGILTEAQAERYDELAERDVLDDAGQAELAGLTAIQDGGYTDAQRAVARVSIYVRNDGTLGETAAWVRSGDRAGTIKVGDLTGYAATCYGVASNEDSPQGRPIWGTLERPYGWPRSRRRFWTSRK